MSLVRRLHQSFQQPHSTTVDAETLALLEARIRKLQSGEGGFAKVRLSENVQALREQRVLVAPGAPGPQGWATGPLFFPHNLAESPAVNDGPGGHIPVLSSAVVQLLAPQPGETVLDGTVGLGGHAALLAARIGPTGRLIGLDVDPANLSVARERLASLTGEVVLRRENFRDFDVILDALGIAEVEIMFLDLGVSSTQIDQADRGFSFQSDGPLDMRMDDRESTTAADLINRLPETELGDLIFYNSQEHSSRKIARKICQIRREGRITTTSALVRAVADALHVNPDSRRSKIHPATLTFQALRIAVNDELGALQGFLDKAPKRLKPGGRIGVISFHSLEDRIVKSEFARRREEGTYRVLTKKPLVAEEEERQDNPRSRSAKLRVAVRTEQCVK